MRGARLTRADRHFATGSGLLARLWTRLVAKGFHRILDRIDTGLEAGQLNAHLPDGSYRILGARGAGPTAEVTLASWNALVRLASSGSVGWYKAWDLGEWTSPDPVPLFDLFMRNRASLGTTARAGGVSRLINRIGHGLRRNSRSGSRRNIEFHYDLGNDFYALWLDATMSYSSALFADLSVEGDSAEPLEEAQRRKLEAIAGRLQLQPGNTVLEIGCGWGALARHLAHDRGAHVTGLTLSREQAEWARSATKGLSVEIVERDYRDETGRYDAIASVEMVEAVGQDYWPEFLDCIAGRLKPSGRAALQYIRIEDDIFERYADNVDFIQAYIFPGGMLLSESRFRSLAEARGLEWRDQRDMGLHYAETLKRWRANFDLAVEEGRLPAGFDAHFVRLWRYYLMYCEGGFRGGGINVAQVTLVKR